MKKFRVLLALKITCYIPDLSDSRPADQPRLSDFPSSLDSSATTPTSDTPTHNSSTILRFRHRAISLLPGYSSAVTAAAAAAAKSVQRIVSATTTTVVDTTAIMSTNKRTTPASPMKSKKAKVDDLEVKVGRKGTL